MNSGRSTRAARPPAASDGPLLLSLASLSQKDMALLEAAARKDELTLHELLLKRIEMYARFLASRDALRRRAIEKNDRVFAPAYKTILERGERPTAHRLAQLAKRQHRAAQRWLQLRHPRLRRTRRDD